MGTVMGWQGTWAVAAAFGGEVQFTPQTSEDDPIQALFARAATEQQPKPIRKLSELPPDDPARLAIEEWERKGGYKTEHTPKQNTDRNKGGRPRGTNFDETDKKIRKQILMDWRDGTNIAKQKIGTFDKYEEMENPLQALEKRTLRYLFGKYATKFGWTREPCKTQVRLLIRDGKLSEVFV